MSLFTILETCRHEVEANSPEEAEEIYSNAQDEEFFVDVDDYIVFDDRGSPCLSDGEPAPLSREAIRQKHAEFNEQSNTVLDKATKTMLVHMYPLPKAMLN